MTGRLEDRSLKRVVHYRSGDPRDVLRVEDARSWASADDRVLVRVSRAAIHPGDLQLIAGAKGGVEQDMGEGRVPGFEAVGVISAASDKALSDLQAVSPLHRDLRLGSRVVFFGPGAWQTRVAVPVAALTPVPDDVPDDVAAQLLVNAVTARHVLRSAFKATRTRRFVQSGAASAVGKLVTVFALQADLLPIRLVRSAQSAARLSEILPGGYIIDTSAPLWKERLRDVAGGDPELIIDGVGGGLLGELADMAAHRAHVFSYGRLSDQPSDLSAFIPKALSLKGITIGTWSLDTTAAEQAEDRKAAIAVGRTSPNLFAGARVFPFEELDAALVAASAPDRSGIILLKP